MNADELLRYYERVADAPDAVARLRRFVLDLAVRGKLVAQQPKEQPAGYLLAQIATERARLVKAGVIRETKPLPPNVEAPFPIPETWRWTQLAEIGLISPRNEAADATAASFVPMTLIAAEHGVEHRHEVRPWGEVKKGYTHFADGDVGLAKITPCFENGKSTVFRNLTAGIGSGTTELHIVRPLLVLSDYILLFLKCPYFIETGVPRMTGTAGQKRVPADYFAHSPFPLPPLAEQHRIVAKVDELMALCDRLEAARKTRETARDRLAAASLARLNAPDPETFHEDARFALDTLSALTTRPDQIKPLRQTILNLAVRGHLSRPQGWQTEPTALGKVASLQNGYAFKSEWFSTAGARLLRNANVGHGKLNWADEVRLPESQAAEYERFQLLEGDVVLSLDRPFILTGTKVARVKGQDLPALLLQRVGRFVLTPELHPAYLFLWINSPHFTEQIDPGRSNGVPHISSRQVEAAMMFVPPITEQHRIVAKVDELMALCDRLEASLSSTDSRRRRLLEALLHNALQPSDLALAAA